LFAPEPI